MGHIEEPYVKGFDAEVVSVAEGKYVVLSTTLFYPLGGGQPHDEGTLARESDGKEFRVLFVKKFGDAVSHEVAPEGLAPGDRVRGEVDWARRHKLMRSHTAAHILCAVIGRATGAKITGNQLELDKVRFDFSLDEFNPADYPGYVAEANRIIAGNHPVSSRFITREEALRIPEVSRLMSGLPGHIEQVRIVEIEGVDLQACGGTHVRNTSEIGELRFLRCENKGKQNRRLYFELA